MFYNNSSFDGNDPAPGAADDNAIAPDITPLLPGNKATLANISNYSRGINGLMIDVLGLSAVPSSADFEFKIGTSTDPTTWATAPAPTSISIRSGVGPQGATRITLIWPDNWIQNTWLQVRIKATSDTGLLTDDVFYVGNLIGESGSNPNAARIDASDVGATNNQPYTVSNLAPITARPDYDRDGLINATDAMIAQHTYGKSLPLLTVPSAPAPLPSRGQPDLFSLGDAGILDSFAPVLVTTKQGSVLAFAEERYGTLDNESYAISLRRSTNGGASWSPISTVVGIPRYSGSILGGPTAVVDSATGTIFLLYVRDMTNILVTSSSDDGLTWSTPVDITSNVKVTDTNNPNPAAFPNTPWGLYNVGPGHGIQITTGGYAGRIVIDANYWLESDPSQKFSNVIYSDDHGATWHLGGGPNPLNPQNAFTTENSIIQMPDGSLYMVLRDYPAQGIHAYSRSTDGGMTWSDVLTDPNLATGLVDASTLASRRQYVAVRRTRRIRPWPPPVNDLGQPQQRRHVGQDESHRLWALELFRYDRGRARYGVDCLRQRHQRVSDIAGAIRSVLA